MIRDNLAGVAARLEAACRKAGRKREDVRLVAATKTVAPERILEAAEAGVREVGENRVQEALAKRPACAQGALAWHMIGRLQRNKVNRAVEIFDLIQSVDSWKLVQAIDRRAGELNKVQGCLVEVKVSEEETKAGLKEEDLDRFLQESAGLTHVRVLGLMTLAPYSECAESARPYFARARAIFERRFGGAPGSVLSMGMSDDFAVAVEEGSTLVRVGRAIFGERAGTA